MKILLLAPHPFYQERGTPIAVDLLLTALSKRGCKIEVITFHEGIDQTYPNVAIHRIPNFSFIKGIGPGFSLKKIFCDVFVFFKALRQAMFNRPDVVHAVEESVYMALVFRGLFQMPYVYDMDSSMAAQLVEKMPRLKPLRGFFQWWEGLAVRHAEIVIPVCQALAQIAEKEGARSIRILNDISLLQPNGSSAHLRRDYPTSGTVFMYIGNLESYQGIDLLIEAFAIAGSKKEMTLFIVGGIPEHIEKYRRLAANKDIGARVHLVGPRSPNLMSALFAEADVLVSPRIKGENTPMKIYSYLDSGKAVLATRLPTHTQVIDPDAALLADPTPDALAEGMLALAGQDALRQQLAARAKNLVQQKYSRAAFEQTVNSIYNGLEKKFS
ncbi:MAG: hypothetical protein A2X46_13670 [Lentisphaerae bacterium GWF2_57_35]|nr:MAG: hypothetical protein A2X46_13670 [Lentisphaerae bacterium GWF2_57_35]